MKLLILTLLLLLPSCAKKCSDCEVKTVHHNTPKVWSPVTYEMCDLNVINAPPEDIIVAVNRSDLFYRYDGTNSKRPILVKTDGTTKDLGSPVITIPGQQIATLSDWQGDNILMNVLWEDPSHAMQEEADHGFDYSDLTYFKGDVFFLNLTSMTYINLTQTSVSRYNSGARFIPGGALIGFLAMINSNFNDYLMNRDGSNKVDASSTPGFSYGNQPSPNNSKYAFLANYKLFIGDTVTRVEAQVNTPCSFNFYPQWSPDSRHLVFFCDDSDVYMVNSDGSSLHKIYTRNGPFVTVPFVDGEDFHGGGSDLLTWWNDSIILSDYVGNNVELFKFNVNTLSRVQLTHGVMDGSYSNFPAVKGDYLSYTSTRAPGKRDLYYMNLNTLVENQITDMPVGCNSSYPRWSRPND